MTTAQLRHRRLRRRQSRRLNQARRLSRHLRQPRAQAQLPSRQHRLHLSLHQAQRLQPTASAAPNLVRNDKGETEAYASKSADMEDASVISCVIESNDIYNSLMNSAFANCSKVDDEGTTLYLDGDEYVPVHRVFKGEQSDLSSGHSGKE